MRHHFSNLGLMLVLIGLLALPILGYSYLMDFDSSKQVLSETDVKTDLIEDSYNLDFKKVELDSAVIKSSYTVATEVGENTDDENNPTDESTPSLEEEFDPANYDPAEADLYLD